MPKKRQFKDPGLDHWATPSPNRETYGDHVKLRASHFCFVVYRVASLCLKYRPSKNFKAYLSDTADMQVGQGIYGAEKVDAAHLCNTSFLCDLFLSDINNPISTDLRTYCDNLREMSGATTPQFKIDNVGPDKVIDSFQTAFKNSWLDNTQKQASLPSGPKLYQDYVAGLNLALSQSKSKSFSDTTSGGHTGAKKAKFEMVALQDILDNGEIPWDLENEFKCIDETTAAL